MLPAFTRSRRRRIEGKTIVVTGASSGIGAATALALAARGARVCLVARREDELGRVRQRIEDAGGTAWIHAVDLCDMAAVDACAAAILAAHGRVDILVNNAGRSIRRPVREALERFHDYERVMRLNYFAAVKLTLALLPGMLQRHSGHIVNVSSLSTLLPTPRFSAYVASKCALEGFSRSLAAELVDEGVHVSLVHFPLVKTDMSAPTAIYRYLPQLEVDEAAQWIVKAIERRPFRVASSLGVAWSLASTLLPKASVKWTGRIFRRVGGELEVRAKNEAARDADD